MVMRVLNLRLWRLFKHIRGQYFAVLSVVFVGLFVYTALSIASINLNTNLDYYYQEAQFADIFTEVVSITPQDVTDIQKDPYILLAQGRHVLEVPVITENEEERVKVRVISLTTEKQPINRLHLVEGSLIGPHSQDILVLEQFANARGLHPGDTLTFQANGRQYKQQIQGIVGSPEFVYLMESEQSLMPNPSAYGVIYVSDSFAAKQLGLAHRFNEVLIKIDPSVNPELMVDVLEDRLNAYGVKRIYERKLHLSYNLIDQKLTGLEKMSSSVPIVFLLVAGIILVVMVQRMVKKDRTSIGILKSMGYDNRQIIIHYVLFALSIGLLGGFLGTTIGLIASGYMTDFYVTYFNIPMLKVTMYYKYVFYSMALSMAFCAGAGIWGARDVVTIMPADSMRPESPKIGKRILLERLPFLWNKITFRWKFVIRNLLRNKRRFVFIAVGIALTYSITLFTAFMWNIFDVMFIDHYTNFQMMDYNVQFTKPLSQSVLSDFNHLMTYDDLEPKNEFPFELENGVKSRVITVIGLQEDTVFYHFINQSGDTITVPAEGMLLSKNIAQILGVSKGDKVTVKSYIADREDTVLTVTDIIEQHLGGNAYMNIETMNRMLLDEGMMTGVYINSSDDVAKRLSEVPLINSVQSQQEISAIFKDFLGLIIVAISFMVMMGGVLGFAIVYTATSMSINERKMEFSSLRVMGFSGKEIYEIINRENALIATLGIIFGIPIGRALLMFFGSVFTSELFSLETAPGLITYLIAGIVTIGFIIIAQFATRQKISKLKFLEALKNRIA